MQDPDQAFQKMKFINFFLVLCVIFALLDPALDPNSGSGSRDPIESGSTTLQARVPNLIQLLFHIAFADYHDQTVSFPSGQEVRSIRVV
jgi:hypothetical protein